MNYAAFLPGIATHLIIPKERIVSGKRQFYWETACGRAKVSVECTTKEAQKTNCRACMATKAFKESLHKSSV